MQSPSIPAGRFAVVEIDDPRWVSFVTNHPFATPFHQPVWAELVADCYRFRAAAAVSLDASGAIVAGTPLLEIGARRPRWTSLSFTDRCAPLAADAPTLTEFARRLDGAREALGLRSIEIRDCLEGVGWLTDEGYWHELKLTPDPQTLYASFHKSRVKAPIRRAAREGVVVERGRSPEDLVKVFYGLHVTTRRRLGVPVQTRRFFELLWERMLARGLGFVLTARLADVPIASAVFLAANGYVTYKFSASDRRYGKLGAANALLWQAIQDSCVGGARALDFGRTEPGNQGLRAFKLGWGADEQSLRYTVSASSSPSRRLHTGQQLLKPLIRRSPAVVARAIGAVAYRYTA